MKCDQCGNVQNEGRFCGECGAELISLGETEASATTTEQQLHTVSTGNTSTQNEIVQNVQSAAKNYWTYLLNYLKEPSQIFQTKSREYVNSIITLGLIALIFIITFYTIVRQYFMSTFGEFGDFISGALDASSFTLISSTFFYLALTMITPIILVFIINKYLGTEQVSFIESLSLIGTHLNGVLALLILGFLLSLLHSQTFAMLILILSLSLISLYVPLYIVSRLLIKPSKKIDAFYGYLIYIVGYGIIIYILGGRVLDSKLGEVIDWMM